MIPMPDKLKDIAPMSRMFELATRYHPGVKSDSIDILEVSKLVFTKLFINGVKIPIVDICYEPR